MKHKTKQINYHKKRQKKVKINKVRFTIFILSCLLILFGVGLGIKSLLTDDVDVVFKITDDLNPTVGESLFKLLFDWELEDLTKYKEVKIIVDEKEYTLDTKETHFEVDLTEANQSYNVVFQAKKRGIVFSKKVKELVTTLPDNEGLEQSVTNLKLEDGYLSFEHELKQHSVVKLNAKSLTYQAKDLVNHIIVSGETEILNKEKDSLTLKVSFPVEAFSDSSAINVYFETPVKNILLATPLRDIDYHVEGVNINPFDLIFEQQELILMNNSIAHYNYKDHDFYAENLYLTMTSKEEIDSYQLVNLSGQVVKEESYSLDESTGIDLAYLNEGNYFVKLNHLPIYVDDLESEVWYTVTRNNQANQVTLERKSGQLSLHVETVAELPDDVYDILIDPGHGGLDGGTVAGDLIEAEEALKVSTYIAKRLEDHGLKVKLTRTDDLDPAGEGNFDYGKSPFFDEGRVEQVYRYQTKYMISNHLNSFDTTLQGFEIYSSVVANDDWPSRIASAFVEAGHVARDTEKSEFRVSPGSYKKYYLCTGSSFEEEYGCEGDYLDYLYIIRETGGHISHSTSLVEYNENYNTIPHFGAETILIEYAYLDNASDYKKWLNNWEDFGEAVVKATVEYLGITYKK